MLDDHDPDIKPKNAAQTHAPNLDLDIDHDLDQDLDQCFELSCLFT